MSKNYNQGPLDRIFSATIEGLEKGDLSGLNNAIEESVVSVLNNVGDKLNKMGDVQTTGQPKPMSQHRETYTEGEATRLRQQKLYEERAKRQAEAKKREQERQKAEVANRARQAKKMSPATLPVPFNPVGQVSSVLCMTGGGIGLAFTGLRLVRNVGLLLAGTTSLTGWIFTGVCAVVFGGLLNGGIFQKNRLKKAKRYAVLCGSKQYIGLEDLASASNQSVRKTLSDIKRYIKKGFYPEGHLDSDKTTVMFSDSVYSEYVKSMKGRKAIETEKNAVIDTTARVVEEPLSELDQMIKEGNEYIAKLHKLNDDIPGEIITARLNRLETLLTEIFDCVKKHPEQMPRMHEVMNYYLPTITKLVEAYKEYDGISEPDKEIIEAKQQIENSLDTINGALRKILNKLFKDSVWDVTTDATVLNTMLAQKGLASPFENKDGSNS